MRIRVLTRPFILLLQTTCSVILYCHAFPTTTRIQSLNFHHKAVIPSSAKRTRGTVRDTTVLSRHYFPPKAYSLLFFNDVTLLRNSHQQEQQQEVSTNSNNRNPAQMNQSYKEKRLQERMNKLFHKLQSTTLKSKSQQSNSSLIQKQCDELLGICAASNDWKTFEDVRTNIMQKLYNIHHMKASSFRSCLRECYATGNGNSSIRIFEMIRKQNYNEVVATDDSYDNIVLEGEDIDLIIGALCKEHTANTMTTTSRYNNNNNNNNNNNDKSAWKKALEIIHYAAEHHKDIHGNKVKVESYNQVLSTMEHGKHWEEAISLLHLMEGNNGRNISRRNDLENDYYHPSPNLATYHAVLNVLIASNQLEQSSSLLLSLSNHHLQQSQKQAVQDYNTGIVMNKPKPSTYTFEIVISALTRNDHYGRNYLHVKSLLDAMISLDVIVPIEIFNRVISSCAKARKTNDAMDIFTQLKSKKVQPDTVTYNSLISACAYEGWTKDALALFNECRNENRCQPDVITYTNMIRACGKGKMVKKALKLLADAKKESIPLDVFIYTALIDVCGKDKQWRIALDLLTDMKRNNIIANQHTYSSVINALGTGGQWERALEILNQMKEKGMNVNVVTYNSAINALAKASRDGKSDVDRGQLWIKALELLDQMKSERVWPDKYTYSSVIACCASGARYQEAIDLIQTMRDGPAKIRPNTLNYTGAITACARAGEWSHALRLFNDMKSDGIKCDVVTYNALLSAYMNGGKPDMAYDLWNEMSGTKKVDKAGNTVENIKPDIVTLTNVIASLERSKGEKNLSRMDIVFEDAVERQIILSDDSMDTKWELDLSGMSLPVARSACRYILKRILRTTKEADVESLMLITGVGKNHQLHNVDTQDLNIDNEDELTTKRSRTALREYVRHILREDFEPPLYSVVPSNAVGTVQINKEMLVQWMKEQR